MPTLHYIAKAATPEQLSWRARIAAAEPPLVAAFLSWVASLRSQIEESQIMHAVASRSIHAFDHVLQAVSFQPLLSPVAEREALRSFDDLVHDLSPSLRTSLNLHDPNFVTAVREHEARLVREVTTETRRAIANMIERAYRDGLHPYQVAPEIREAVGLTARQGQAVLNFAAAQVKAGAKPEVAAKRAERYAAKLRTRRAKLIARTETARAQTYGRIASWQQAAEHGLFDAALAEMEWSAVQDDPTEICAQLDGTRVPLGETWPGGLLPGDAHPACRCAPILRLNVAPARPLLTLAR